MKTEPTQAERLTLPDLLDGYIAAHPELTKSYRCKLRRVVRGIVASQGVMVLADQLGQRLLDAWEAFEGGGRCEATIVTLHRAYMLLWGEAWRQGLTDEQPAGNSRWVIEEGQRRILRGRPRTLCLAEAALMPSAITHLPERSLRRMFRESYLPRKLRAKSANAVRLHEGTLNGFAAFLGREGLLDDLSDDTVSRFLAWIRSRGRTASTANNCRNRLLALWRFAARKRLIDNEPDVEPDPEPKRTPRGRSREELVTLFAALAAQRGAIAGVPAAKWWIALHLLIWDCGERISAVLATRWDWIDFGASVLNMPAEARKGKREDRRYPLHPATVELLLSIRQPARELVVPVPWCVGTLYHRYDRILTKAGLPTGASLKFHCIRKSVASHGKAAGLDPQELMGHADGRVTRRYLDPAIVGQPATASRLFRPDGLRLAEAASPVAAPAPMTVGEFDWV